MLRLPLIALACGFILSACGGGGGGGSIAPPPPPPPPPTNAIFDEVTASTIGVVSNACMDAAQGDLDGDGDIDLALASEFALNVILINNGSGVFSQPAGAITDGGGDNEDLRLGDFDGDGDLDMISVHEDDREHVLLFNDGNGSFSDMSALIPVMSTANAVEVIDLDGDGRLDILIGNEGPNIVLMQQPDGSFVDDTANRPLGLDTTQDLLLVDVDNDTDMDVFVVNEGPNVLLINDGNGFFTDESATRLDGPTSESRQADAADVDNDGDMDIVIGNVRFLFPQRPIENQLLRNDGAGNFTDVSATALANVTNLDGSFTIHFIDVDSDGDADIFSPRTDITSSLGDAVIWLNDGTGVYSNATTSDILSAPVVGDVFDVEVFDANGDGNDDLFICNRSGDSQLYVR